MISVVIVTTSKLYILDLLYLSLCFLPWHPLQPHPILLRIPFHFHLARHNVGNESHSIPFRCHTTCSVEKQLQFHHACGEEGSSIPREFRIGHCH